MGNYAMILVLSALAASAMILISSRTSSVGAGEEVNQHTFKTVAREASVTGLNLTVRKLVADTSSWVVDPSLYEYTDQRRSRLFARRTAGTQLSLGRSRACDGRRGQRHGPRKPTIVRSDVFRIYRLLPAIAAIGGDHASAVDLRLHARFDRSRRGRSNASTDRTLGRLPGDSSLGRSPSR